MHSLNTDVGSLRACSNLPDGDPTLQHAGPNGAAERLPRSTSDGGPNGAAAQLAQRSSSGHASGTGQAPGRGSCAMTGGFLNRGPVTHAQSPLCGAFGAHAHGGGSSRRHAWTAAAGTAQNGTYGTGEAAPRASVPQRASSKRAGSGNGGEGVGAPAGVPADSQALEKDKRKRMPKRKGLASRVTQEEGHDRCERDQGKPQDKQVARGIGPTGTVVSEDVVPPPPGQTARKRRKKKLESGTDAPSGIELARCVIEAFSQSPGFRVVDRLPDLSHMAPTCGGLVLLGGGTASHLCTSLRPFDKAARQGIAKAAKAAAARTTRALDSAPQVDVFEEEGEEQDRRVNEDLPAEVKLELPSS